MHIKPYLEGEIGRGKSGFAVNRGFTVLEENGTIRGHETHLHRKNKDSNQSSLQTRKFSKKYFTVFKSKL